MRVKGLLRVAASLVLGLALVEGFVRFRQWYLHGSALTSYYQLVDDPVSGLRLRKLVARALETVPGLAGYEEYNRVVREVTAESGAILVEDEPKIPGDEVHFADSVHFLDEGQRLQAERVVAALTAAPAYRRWIDAHRGH